MYRENEFGELQVQDFTGHWHPVRGGASRVRSAHMVTRLAYRGDEIGARARALSKRLYGTQGAVLVHRHVCHNSLVSEGAHGQA